MKCPQCLEQTTPTEVDLEFEVAQYDCRECHTSWHLTLGQVDEQGMPEFAVQDGSTWYWLVTFETDPKSITPRLVPGRKIAISELTRMMTTTITNWDKIGDSTLLEFSASADPQHVETHGRCMNINVKIEVTSAVEEEIPIHDTVTLFDTNTLKLKEDKSND